MSPRVGIHLRITGSSDKCKTQSLIKPHTRCKSMSNNFTFVTAGGRIRCLQCQAKSKRTKQQCRAPASKGKTKCRFHGGASTGPKTPEGRQRCAEAKTVHSNETRQARSNRAAAMRRLRALEDLGHALGIMHGPRMRGQKPSTGCTRLS